MTKTLETLYKKAQKSPKGYAFKNGRESLWGGAKGPLCKIWEIKLEEGIFKLYHYSTLILKFDTREGEILDWHIQSLTDSRALSWAFFVLGFGWKFTPHWYPSKGLAKIDGI